MTSRKNDSPQKTTLNHNTRQDALTQAINTRILVIDGAMGTALQNKNLTAADFGGEAFEGCNENLVLTRPDVIAAIHEDYLAHGADIIETNTFGATPLVLDEYDLGSKAAEINKRAVELARKACAKYDSPEKPRFVAGAIGPTTKAISVTGGITFEQLIENFYVQALALFDAGADYFLIETCQDTRNIKACLLAIDKVHTLRGYTIPIAISGTIEPMGTMLAGQSVDALAAALENRELLYLGLNCATGPEFMTDHIRTLHQVSKFRIGCVPNAGLPDENGCYLETPAMLTKTIEDFAKQGWLNVIGGCCGTHSGHIKALQSVATQYAPRAITAEPSSRLSGIDALEITDDLRPILVGERTNVIGSKKFKDLIIAEKFEEASEVARAQVKKGAHIIDVCLANPDRDELSDITQFLEFATKKIRVPIMIDSTDEAVIERALTFCQGKAIINSINLEDGEERFEKVIPLAKQYGAALVVGCIDDDPNQGMGVSRERKLAIAERSYQLLTEKYGIAPEDIYWDPLVFPCATGDAQYVGSAVETIEGVRLIKQRFPKTKTVLGISNVSFGLPNAGREVLNSVFLYHCVQAGLDLAIVNTEKLERFAQIPAEERLLAENLLYNRGDSDPIAAFAAHFRQRKQNPLKNVGETLPLEKRLANYIIEGSKDGLTKDLDEALTKYKPLDIINGPLMTGMDEVGRLFNTNQLIVAEVLQSAESMKAAVAHLEPFMEKSESSTRGRVLLATVKGDVHDIGKNLVDIILSNNGFEVINLGIKVLPETLIQAARTHKPDIIGLSGLLVKSAQQMTITAADFTRAEITTPILVGGAALSEGFVDRQIAPVYKGTVAYASDAMNGLELAKTIVDKEKFETLKNTLKLRREALAQKTAAQQKLEPQPVRTERSTSVQEAPSLPQPPDFDRHLIRNTPLETIWRYINPLMLYGRHLGVPGGVVRAVAAAAPHFERANDGQNGVDYSKAIEIFKEVETVKDIYKNSDILKPAAVYQFFRAQSQGNALNILNADGSTLSTFEFPRQTLEPQLCLADYVSSRAFSPNGPCDNIALFVVTVGRGLREEATKLKDAGAYLRSHILQALALETAEGYAEYLHSQLRKMWGFADAPDMTMMQRFQAKYQGKRYSFGYPACPRLDDQQILFKLLQAEEIGVELTDGFMMEPEASVSAITFHHPQAKYFSVGGAGDGSDDNRTT